MKFYKCNICGKIITMVNPVKVDTICCNQPMVELKANSVDASLEKHVPVLKTEGNKLIVTVGSINHPMEDKHYIQWICLETNLGQYFKYLKPSDRPIVNFNMLDNEQVINVYAYCNIHGLWKQK